ncbi:AraC family ligand binding domain-containing protein [Photobacterium phosphoreum]|uniref:AraC family ligand binding domain-containing protein n=1 Tax=Photobacterium phosphoreum TaxID=659 RepID=UPI0024B77AF0|nr:AraC family ligand binding domain-containing protein [Photobacterium phosphoreum]
MKQAIEFSKNEHPFLSVGSRRKSNNAYFIVVTNGCLLIRLGKHEHLVSKGHGFWVPFDCLHALTVLPGSHFLKVAFSIRLRQPLCRDAGFFVVNPLLDALLVELAKQPTENHDWEGVEGRLLKVIADQVSNLSASTQSLSPAINKQCHSALALLLNGNKITEQSAIQHIEPILGMTLKEFESCITIREAVKLIRSGRKLAQIATQLNTSEVLLEALAIPILGKPF